MQYSTDVYKRQGYSLNQHIMSGSAVQRLEQQYSNILNNKENVNKIKADVRYIAGNKEMTGKKIRLCRRPTYYVRLCRTKTSTTVQ